MSERDDPEAMWHEWFEEKQKYGYAVLSREEWMERLDAAATDGYANGREDEMQALAEILLPGTPYYMDPPDGGDVTYLEQFKRAAQDAVRYRWLRAAFGDKLRAMLDVGDFTSLDAYIDRKMAEAEAV